MFSYTGRGETDYEVARCARDQRVCGTVDRDTRMSAPG